MVLIDEDYVKDGKKICANLLAAFRYGREDLDVLGLTFRKDLISQTCQVSLVAYPEQKDNPIQVYPPDETKTRPLTRLQERLKKKLGDHAYPFWFSVPTKSASSVTLQPAPGDTGKVSGAHNWKSFW